MIFRSFAAGLCLVTAATFVNAQQTATVAAVEYSIKENYTKYEYRMPMRDGKNLFAAVYVPKDQSKSYPFLMERTPYSAGPYGVDFTPRRLGPRQTSPRRAIFLWCRTCAVAICRKENLSR